LPPAGRAGYHQIETYLKCPKRFQFDKVRKVGLPIRATPDYFVTGTMVHAGRAAWFISGFKTDAVTWAFIKEEMEKCIAGYDLPVGPGVLPEAIRYVEEYVEHYAMRPHPSVIGAEYNLGPADIGDGEVRTARLDDISFYPEAGRKLCVGECKTTGTDIATTVSQYQLHGQPILQAMLWRAAAQGAAMHGDISGVMLDVIQKGYRGKRCQFARVFIEVTETSRVWWSKMLAKAIREARDVTWDSEPDRRITSCTEMSGSRRVACPYRPLCQHGRDAALEFVTADGKRLTEHERVPGKERMPWE
jgi:hypothetical protein